MQTWIVWTTEAVTEAALRRFAEASGGYWNEVVGDEVVIERVDARVFVSSASTDDEDNVIADDLARATAQMGHSPTSMLSMRIGHASGSVRLAEDVAARAIREWGGILDRNED